MNDLEQFFNRHTGRLIHKWRHYFEIYDRHFSRFRGKPINIVEFGVSQGGSMQMWRDYLQQQIRTFEALFPRVAPNGVYLCEDLHTSYWREFGGGYRRRGSFIEYSKNFINALHAWHSREPQRLSVSDFTRSAHSVHYYDSVVVVEKRAMEPPTHHRVGEATFADYQPPKTGVLASIKRRVQRADRG